MASRTLNIGVFPNAYAKRDTFFHEIKNPVFSNEFTISSDKVDAISAKNVEKSLEKSDSFVGIRTSLFVERRPKKRNANSLVSDAKHHEIDIELSKFPVGSVKTENPFFIKRHELGEKTSKKRKVKRKRAQKALDAFVMRFNLRFSFELLCKLHEICRLGVE